MANWSYNTPVGQQGSTTSMGAGGGMNGSQQNLAGFRSILDAKRAMVGKTPNAEYPDGYLGNITDRREDKLLQHVRENARSYTRGVHKGSRIEAQDYFWPEDFNPYTGLEYQKQGKKWTAQGAPVERLVYGDKWLSQAEEAQIREQMNLPPDPQMRNSDPEVRAGLRKNLPAWR
jgi:hypothetical protein